VLSTCLDRSTIDRSTDNRVKDAPAVSSQHDGDRHDSCRTDTVTGYSSYLTMYMKTNYKHHISSYAERSGRYRECLLIMRYRVRQNTTAIRHTDIDIELSIIAEPAPRRLKIDFCCCAANSSKAAFVATGTSIEVSVEYRNERLQMGRS
jgi:hypothetical protein